MRTRAYVPPLAAALLPLLAVASRAPAASRAPCWLDLDPPAASAAASGATSGSTSPSSAPTVDEVAEAAARRRARERREQNVEVIDLTPEQELDPQRFAVGGDAGLGWLTTRGSGAGQLALDFSLVVAFGLGPGGARVPWTIEGFAAFALTGSTLGVRAGHPDRFTELGARVVHRFAEGPLRGRWASIGAGLAFSSWGDPKGAHGQITPGALVDLGIGVQEWVSRKSRAGLALRIPVELSAHPGIGAIVVFYAQIGLVK